MRIVLGGYTGALAPSCLRVAADADPDPRRHQPECSWWTAPTTLGWKTLDWRRMKQRPAIYDSVLVIGSDRPATSGLPVARLGGIWAQPNIGLSYLLAALHVIEQGEAEHRLNEVALPAAYLQRHAFEVALKDLIEIALVIKADEAWVAILKDDAKGKRPRQAEVPFIHDVVKLVVVLRQAFRHRLRRST